MNKADLVNMMADAADISKAQASKALDAMLDSIVDALKNGDKVTLVNFGTFSVSERAARTGRNPRTNKEIQIPAKRVAKFKAGKVLADGVEES
ncbi:MAG: HU family DNA-binding protein [Acidobacteriota bacterium]|nr:HU family DNA-binding protein [Acidobacteriota bacterium]